MADSLERLNYDEYDDDNNDNDDNIDDHDHDDIYLVGELMVCQLELSWNPVILEVSRLAWVSWCSPRLRMTVR